MAYDLVVIGAGITGLGVFEAAARNGLSCALLEQGRAGGATTGVTSGLFHGGLRYLPYDAATAFGMCREISRLQGEAPALMTRQPFLWPVYGDDPAGPFAVGALMDYYDSLAELRGVRPHSRLGVAEAAERVPGLSTEGFRAAYLFDEWRADVPALVRHLAGLGAGGGGTLRESARVVGFEREGERIRAALLSGGERVEGRAFVNAAGPWAPEVAALAGAFVRLTLRAGAHLVLEGPPPATALLFTEPSGRYIGLYPRPGESWIGPTDTPFDGVPGAARPPEGTEESLRRAVRRVLPGVAGRPGRVALGLRPLFEQRGAGALLSRDHRVIDHEPEGSSNLWTVVGGKLTTYRPMADEVVGAVCRKAGRAPRAQPPDEYRPKPPWRWLGRHRRGLSFVASGAMLAYYALRRAARGAASGTAA